MNGPPPPLRHGIGRKIWAVFVQQIVAVSLTGLFAIYLLATLIQDNLVRDVLLESTASYVRQLADQPATIPPTSYFVSGYVSRQGAAPPGLPAQFADLSPGMHPASGDGNLAVQVTDTSVGRLYMVFSSGRVRPYVFATSFILVGVILLTVYLTAWIAYRASRRALAPVVVLADTVREWDPKRSDIDELLPETSSSTSKSTATSAASPPRCTDSPPGSTTSCCANATSRATPATSCARRSP